MTEGSARRGLAARVGTLSCLTVGLSLVASACAGNAAPSAKVSATTSSTAAATRRLPPGTFGKVAAISGSTLEVQNSSGQTSVKLTSTTTITATTKATVADLVVGSCVSAVGTKSTTGVVAAQNITITQPGPNGCTAQRGGFAGAGFIPGGGGSRASSRGPGASSAGGASSATRSSVARSGKGRRPPANFGHAFGKLDSVSGSTLVISGSSGQSTVKVSSSTRYTKVQQGTASSLAVGDCVAATGPSNSIGAVTAKSVTILPASPSGCTVGFRRGGTANFGSSGTAPASNSSSSNGSAK